MRKIRKCLKKAFTPITIMVIPHQNAKSLNIRVPSIAIVTALILTLVGSGYVASLAIHGLEYEPMKQKLNYYSREFCEWSSTVNALKKAEADFREIFAQKSREEVLETINTEFSGSIDFMALKKELERTVETVDEIKDYLRIQKDIYLATPKGFPVKGRITSGYGKREDPMRNIRLFHSGVDISTSPGSPIRATADGVVSYSAWKHNSGYLIVIEHGCGFSTIYAHNKKNRVKVGQRVKRGEVIGYVGSTGKSTGPHVHYEVWKNGKHVNPQRYLKGRS
jgi:murein DD-endopeptidase MepM/ murein hydrolase activator NlpD